MFKELEEYSHIYSKDSNIIVTEVLENNKEYMKINVVWVAKKGSHIFSPDTIIVKKDDFNKWLKV